MKKMIAVLLMAGLVTTGCSSQEPEQTEPQKQQTEDTNTTNKEQTQPLTQEQEDSLWTVTAPFQTEAAVGGKKVNQTLTGEPGRYGYLAAAPFKAGQKAKLTWKFWDKKAALPGKKFTIKGKHKDDAETKELFAAAIGGPLEGSDASVVSELTLAKAGKWRLDLFVDGKPYGGVIVEVK